MPRTKSLTGFEIEMFTIDKDGRLADSADNLLKQAKKDGRYALKKEISRSMVEIAGPPGSNVPYALNNLLDELEYLTSIGEKQGINFCPLGTYPGRTSPNMRDEPRYRIKKSILGSQRYKIEGRISGFHCHSTLPHGIFDSQLRILKILAHQKIKDSLVNCYNFTIAADPAITCFMQSSPFYEGRYIGKDSRIIMYRGGFSLDNPRGLYANFEEFGGLPHYKITTLDIIDIISSRYENWKALIIKLGLNVKVLSLYGSILDTNWGPIKINPHGTLENRSSDMNHLTNISGMGVILRFIIKKLQDEYFAVVPSEIGIKEPFKVEKDVIYIPPYPYVRDELQKLSAYNGLESETVALYCRNLLRFAESVMPKDRRKLLGSFKKMLKTRKTVSDEIIDFARRRGWEKGTELSKKLACEIAIKHSLRLSKEILATRKLIKHLL